MALLHVIAMIRNGTILLTTVKKNKDFIEKMNVLLPELVTRRLDNSLENDEKFIASVESQVLEIWLDVTTQNANFSGFIIALLTLLLGS